MSQLETEKLTNWFEENKRALPWRRGITPYRVWISEVMLQQTTAGVASLYFEKWMTLFPTIKDLAEAPLEKVMKAWEGLGYYSRARNLHAGAKYILENSKGELPCTREELLKIKGVGDYTAGAILSFAFKKKEPAVDGNVKRVMARFKGFDGDITSLETLNKIKSAVWDFLPDEDPWAAMEALIELGAIVCKKKPLCLSCPLQSSCRAYQMGIERELPYKPAKIKIQNLFRTVIILQCSGHFLIHKVEEKKVMEGLHEFPYIERNMQPLKAAALIESKWDLAPRFLRKLVPLKHSFTRYRATLKPLIFECDEMPEIPGLFWASAKDILELPFSSGHRRILNVLL